MTSRAKTLVIAVIIILAWAGGAFIYFTPPAVAPGPDTSSGGDNPPAATTTPTSTPPATPPATTPPSTTTPPPTTTPTPTGITMATVALHASASSCWTVIRGEVYDLTEWISKHPGGADKIIQLCGIDGTAKFVGQHGGSEKQETALATFKIGVLAQ